MRPLDFVLAGVPKAGTTALHGMLQRHPALFLPAVKEPKYYLCDGRRPDPRGQRGPGDAHSAQEWVWQRDRYEALFAGARPGQLLGESTPFYLYDRRAHWRIRRDAPRARWILVLRDPVDRAYSNWMHLWSDGLEPEADFGAALAREDERVAAGWAPFWHYRRLGLYGEQVEELYRAFPADQVHILRYRDLVDRPAAAVAEVCRFLGVETVDIAGSRPENVRPQVPDDPITWGLARGVRAGAWLGRFAPPQVWRGASRPLLWALHARGRQRPHLSADQRRAAVSLFADDIALLEAVSGRSFADWVDGPGLGAYNTRADAQPTTLQTTRGPGR